MLSSSSDSLPDFDSPGSSSESPIERQDIGESLEVPQKQQQQPDFSLLSDQPHDVPLSTSSESVLENDRPQSAHCAAEQEPKQYRTERASTLTLEDCTTMVQGEEAAKEATRREAQNALKSFYDERRSRIEENKKANLAEVDKLEARKQQTWAKAASKDTPWVVITQHVNFQSINRSSSSESQSASAGEGQLRRTRDLDAEIGNRHRMKLLMKELRHAELKGSVASAATTRALAKQGSEESLISE
ncbi:hypothetical protein FOZ61_001262 [Perkinsus olseni]|uniref:Clathrin light chain n=1 Tax=Perkinsus olseni TaxID=32597 RepID=A0A7J6MFM3_PEROL|nr:hypothetical protein FOZ61_001262 [Perkinsus olseni]KAF4675371.1 hypothetical protein FOL46_002003 [Perkinsus olseni]